MPKSKIYIAHSLKTDYLNDIYSPLKKLLSADFELILPHDDKKEGVFSFPLIKNVDLMVAFLEGESEGRAIEIGWATALGIPVILAVKKDTPLKIVYNFLRDNFKIDLAEYEDLKELLTVIKEKIK